MRSDLVVRGDPVLSPMSSVSYRDVSGIAGPQNPALSGGGEFAGGHVIYRFDEDSDVFDRACLTGEDRHPPRDPEVIREAMAD
jgi:hypothetical protein